MPYEDFNKIDEEYFDTILEEDFVFEGTIKHADSIIVKGNIKGQIESKKILIVGPNSSIEADIKAKTIQCFGKINGNLLVEDEAYFHYPSTLKGDISVPTLTIEKGCNINGRITMVEGIKADKNKAEKSKKGVEVKDEE